MAKCAQALAVLSLLCSASAHYTPTWAVHVPDGLEAADAVAREHGFINLGEIFDNHYHFHHNSVAKRSLTAAPAHHGRLERDTRVVWAKQQKALSRKKRDFIVFNVTSTVESPYVPSPSTATKRDTRGEAPARVKGRPRAADSKFQLNDPKWPHMWYLNRGGGLDMNVIPAWREGITGRGVVVTILDDGLETDHPDLVVNYDPMASYDVNSHDPDPQPRYDMIDSNRHGTRCAGEVAATANNSLCAVGVAFGASVGGVRMLDGDVTDAVEARSLSLNPQHVDIYSASWGPDDDGKTVDGPGELATRAFLEGVTKGRNGKGSIFVWASGNGGREHDNCNCDGYTNSIWTLSISSATERGEVPWYSEMCSSTLAATYSSGAPNEKQVVTTDLHHSCTAAHTGTSASAPLAAGICALALQANRDLTWRDMQHIVVRTARPERLSTGGEWRVNGVGRNVSHSFGYGLLDAAGMVRLARSWRMVPQQRTCELVASKPQRAVPPRSSVTLQLDVNSCPGVNYLEHVQARVSLSAARRGDLKITLTSPAGTEVTLLTPRAHDSSRAGFNSWPFMSVHMWGESPLGSWQLEVSNEGRYMAGPLTQWELIFYGTETPPQDDDVPDNALHDLGGWGPRDPESAEEVRQNGIDDETSQGWHESHSTRDEDSVKAGVEIGPDAPAPRLTSGAGSSSGCATRAPPAPHRCLGLCLLLLLLVAADALLLRIGRQPPRLIKPDCALTASLRLNLQRTPRPPRAPCLQRPTATSAPECAKGLHLFDGRCFSRCPGGTYASEVLMERSARRRNLTYFTKGAAQPVMKRQGIDAPKPTALEAADMEPVEGSDTKSPLVCLPCHYTCATCSGPHNSQCLSCLDDARLFNKTDVEPRFYCYPKTLFPEIDNADWHYKMNVRLSIALFIICFILLYFLTACLIKKCSVYCCGGHYSSNLTRNSDIAYNKLAVDEGQQSQVEIEDEILNAIKYSSDSESDDNLNL